MSELIDRQAAIEAIFKTCRRTCALSHALEKAFERLPSGQPEPLTVNFAREMDRETIERLKDEIKNAPILIMAVNDSAQPDKTYEQGWKDGREALRKEMWQDGRDRLD